MKITKAARNQPPTEPPMSDARYLASSFACLAAARQRCIAASKEYWAAVDSCTCPDDSRRCKCAAAPIIKQKQAAYDRASQDQYDCEVAYRGCVQDFGPASRPANRAYL